MPAVLLAAIALQMATAGCGGFFTDRTTTSTASSQSFTFVSNFNNAGAGTISIYTLNTSTGALITGSTVATGASSDATSFGPAALATAKAGSFLYAANDGGTVSAFSVNATTGALTAISGSPFSTSLPVPTAIAVDPTSKFVYAADSSGAGVAAFSINFSTGGLTKVTGSPFTTTGIRSVGVTAHPNGKFLYLALESFGTGIFNIDTSSGALSGFRMVAPFANGQPQAIALTPAGTLAYVANGFSGVEAYSVNTSTGDLTRIRTGAFATGNNPIAITTDTSGKFVYVVNRDDTTAVNNTITALAIQSDGSLAQITSGVLSLNSPSAVALDPSGKFVFVTNFNNATVATFSINSSTGQLTLVGAVSTGSNPSGIAFH